MTPVEALAEMHAHWPTTGALILAQPFIAKTGIDFLAQPSVAKVRVYGPYLRAFGSSVFVGDEGVWALEAESVRQWLEAQP